MAKKGTKPAKAEKTAKAPKATKAKATKAAAKVETEKRVVGHALVKVGSKEFNDLSERRQNWIRQHAEVAPNMKDVSRILEHNKGLYFIHTTKGEYQVGKMSASGKSFVVDFASTDRDEALEAYREAREGNYGGEKAAPAKPAKKTAKKDSKPAKGKGGKGKTKSKAAAKPAVDDEDELDELLD